jgi:cytochrome c biogenesis protein CcmG/thiol:disulfide interchange protein DsbE
MTIAQTRQRRVAPFVATIVGVVLGALLIVLVTADPNPSDNAESPLLGNPAPAVVSTTLEDETFELARRKGSWVIFNFFNSTCVPCVNEHPDLVAFAEAEAKSANPAELYTIINDDSDGAVQNFFDANGGDWTKVRDNDAAISVSFGVAKVPETWVIDPNGYVRLRIAGQLTETLLAEQLNLLKEQFGS